MLAISALSGKLAEPMTISPDADSDPEAPDEAAAEAVEELEEASGSDDPQADSANAAASPAAINTLARVRVERTDTGYSLAGRGLAGLGGRGADRSGIAADSAAGSCSASRPGRHRSARVGAHRGPRSGPAEDRNRAGRLATTSKVELVACHRSPPARFAGSRTADPPSCSIATTRSDVVARARTLRPVSPGEMTKCPISARIRSPSIASTATRIAPATIIE